MNRIFF
jgi:hypothetical protein